MFITCSTYVLTTSFTNATHGFFREILLWGSCYMNRNICQDNTGPDVDVQSCMSAWTQQRIKANEVELDVLD